LFGIQYSLYGKLVNRKYEIEDEERERERERRRRRRRRKIMIYSKFFNVLLVVCCVQRSEL
jgi:hypothetical protein